MTQWLICEPQSTKLHNNSNLTANCNFWLLGLGLLNVPFLSLSSLFIVGRSGPLLSACSFRSRFRREHILTPGSPLLSAMLWITHHLFPQVTSVYRAQQCSCTWCLSLSGIQKNPTCTLLSSCEHEERRDNRIIHVLTSGVSSSLFSFVFGVVPLAAVFLRARRCCVWRSKQTPTVLPLVMDSSATWEHQSKRHNNSRDSCPNMMIQHRSIHKCLMW